MVEKVITPNEFILRCTNLKTNWSVRDKKFAEWYDILSLKDDLKQTGMESVAGNDPRTGYNLGKHLMVTANISHKISSEGLTNEQITGASYLENYVSKRWAEHERQYRSIGRQGWLDEVISFLLTYGWHAVFAMVEKEKLYAEVWHPAQVYPNFGSSGLDEVAHIYGLSMPAANRKLKQMGWKLSRPLTAGTIIYDYWTFDADGDIVNGTVMGSEYVKLPQKEPELTKVGRLPVFIAPAGGLPDMGVITKGNSWQEHFGESVIATNEELNKNYNRMLTYSQQLMRDTANPRWLELSAGDTPILKESDMFKRGAIFRGSPGESVNTLPVPPIPVELRQMLFDYQNMLQRGMFPWAVFGNIQQQMSYLAMANVAASSLQVLAPYVNSLEGLLSDVDNFWHKLLMVTGYKPHGFDMTVELPEDIGFEAEVNIEVPGYLVQRATVSRMLNPNFRLSTLTIMDRLFPEIKDPLKEMAKVRRDDAMMHPKAITADAIIAYRERSRELREAGDKNSAELYEKLAAGLEAELSTQPQQPQVAPANQEAEMLNAMASMGGTP